MRLEDQKELEELRMKRLSCIDAQKDFKEKVEETVKVPDNILESAIDYKKRKLRELAFESKGKNTVTSWSTEELAVLFAQFGINSSQNDQILLYEQCESSEFRNLSSVAIRYSQALRRCGRITDAIETLQNTLKKQSESNHGEASNFLGDCYLEQWKIASKVYSILHDISNNVDNSSYNFPDIMKEYKSHFNNTGGVTADIALQNAYEAKNNGK